MYGLLPNHFKVYVIAPIIFYNMQNGLTALHLSSQRGYIDVIRVLIKAYSHVNLQDKVLSSLHMEYV